MRLSPIKAWLGLDRLRKVLHLLALPWNASKSLGSSSVSQLLSGEEHCSIHKPFMGCNKEACWHYTLSRLCDPVENGV
ncbi:hypothetical protein JOB18_000768 [Solea senegalensis]|uniref:Secreted protein n=1 Tax=Solea senegalensis TaxID=28829 RepID=A0AAV6S638_SOLSE|nr:hypothetical protein JOB18_000768 [Solea senegalensis]